MHMLSRFYIVWGTLALTLVSRQAIVAIKCIFTIYEGVDRGVGLSPLPPPCLPPPFLSKFSLPRSLFFSPLPSPSSPSSHPFLPPPSPSSPSSRPFTPPSRPLISHLPLTLSAPSFIYSRLYRVKLHRGSMGGRAVVTGVHCIIRC